MPFRQNPYFRKMFRLIWNFNLIFLVALICLGVSYTLSAQQYKSVTYGYVYSRIKSTGVLRVAISENSPPLHFGKGKDKGKGVEIQIANALADFLEVKIKFTPYPSEKVIEAVVSNQVDISIAGLSRSLSRAKKVWFSRPYLWVRSTALIDKRLVPKKRFGDTFEDTPIQTLSDLKKMAGISAVVVKGTIYEQEFSEIIQKRTLTKKRALETMLKGEANVFFHDSIYLKYQVRNNPELLSRYALIEEQKYKEELCIILPFGDILLKNHIDTWILLMRQRNKFQDWLDAYFN